MMKMSLISAFVVGSILSGTFTLDTTAQAAPAAAAPKAPPVAPVPTGSESDLQGLQIETVREALAGIWMHGLNPKNYWTADFEAAFAAGQLPLQSADVLKSYLKALKDVSVGTVNPENLGSDIIFTKKEFIKSDRLQALVASSGGNAVTVLEGVSSQFPQYLSLKEAMRRLYPASLDGSWTALPELKKVLKVGVQDPNVILLKTRLAQYGYNLTDMSDLYNQETRDAVTDVQSQLKFKPDGFISPGGKTWAYLSASASARIAQVQADMEKMRWLQQVPEDRYVFVNTAFTTFSLTDRTSGKLETMNFRTINGRPERKTPSMKDKITHLIFNPFWTVPPTVFIQDKVSHIKELSYWQIADYFEQNNFIVVDDNDRQLDVGSIDWQNIRSSNVDFYIKQLPNYMNALGVVKFMMTNPYAIYLHDTNERERFAEDNRLISSGCVRLQYPLDFAEYLLRGTSWDRARIEDFIVRPGEVLNKETQVNLKTSLPVYILSVTSQVTSDGVLRFTDDVYGHNQMMQTSIKAMGN